MNFKAFSSIGQRSMARLKPHVPSSVLDVHDSRSRDGFADTVPTTQTQDVDTCADSAFEHAAAQAATVVSTHQAAQERLMHAIAALPLDAFRALDVWCADVVQVAASTTTLAPHTGAASYAQFDECVTTARLWQQLKGELASRCSTYVVPALALDTAYAATSSQLTTDVDAAVGAFWDAYRAHGWMYHPSSGMLFYLTHDGTHVGMATTLGAALRGICAPMGTHAPLVLNLTMANVQDALAAAGHALRIDSRLLLFADTVVSMASDGVALRKVDALPRIDVLGQAIAARCFVAEPFAFEAAGAVPPAGTSTALFLEVLGAVLRPSMLRVEDLRPVCVLLTAPAHKQHPWARALEALVGFSLTQYTPGQSVRAPQAFDPYVLCVNCTSRALDLADVHALHTALARNMVVVIVATAPPPVLLHGESEAVQFLRLLTVHVPVELCEDIAPPARLLMQSQTAYNRNKARGMLSHAFVTEPQLLHHRLSYMQTPQTLLLEMLQNGNCGLALVAGAEAKLTAIQSALAAYSQVRCGTAVLACTAEHVMDAVAAFRSLFGQSVAYPVALYEARHAAFKHVSAPVKTSGCE